VGVEFLAWKEKSPLTHGLNHRSACDYSAPAQLKRLKRWARNCYSIRYTIQS